MPYGNGIGSTSCLRQLGRIFTPVSIILPSSDANFLIWEEFELYIYPTVGSIHILYTCKSDNKQSSEMQRVPMTFLSPYTISCLTEVWINRQIWWCSDAYWVEGAKSVNRIYDSRWKLHTFQSNFLFTLELAYGTLRIVTSHIDIVSA